MSPYASVLGMFSTRRPLASLFAALALSGPAIACERIAEVQNVRAGAGPVMVALYSDEASFLKKPARGLRLNADAATLSFPLCGLEGGELAVMVFQDLNDNGRMDFNPFGMPTEPFGASGTPNFGPPSWARARVVLADLAQAPLKLVLSGVGP